MVVRNLWHPICCVPLKSELNAGGIVTRTQVVDELDFTVPVTNPVVGDTKKSGIT